MTIGSVGAYPDQEWYDPNRPSWLPYWLDDFTESEAKYNAQNLLQATANAAGDAAGTVAAAGGTGVANAFSSALGGMDLGTIAILAAAGFLIFTIKK
jgi:hypothetical protein